MVERKLFYIIPILLCVNIELQKYFWQKDLFLLCEYPQKDPIVDSTTNYMVLKRT